MQQSARNLIIDNYCDMDLSELVTLPTKLFRSIHCSEQIQSLEEGVSAVRLFFEANPNELSARLLNEMTAHSSASMISKTDAQELRTLIGQLDPEKEDKDSWLALSRLCTECAESMASEWENIDIGKCMEDFQNPRVSDDYYGSGRLVVSLLVSALEQAKVDHAKEVQHKQRLQQQLTQQKSLASSNATRIANIEADNTRLRSRVLNLESEANESSASAAKRQKTTPIAGYPYRYY